MSISVTVSGEDSTSIILTQPQTGLISISGDQFIDVTAFSGDSATVIVSSGDPITITGNYSNYATGDVVRPPEISDFLTENQINSKIITATGDYNTLATNSFYPKSNPSGYITGVDLSDYVEKSETGAFYASSNPSGYITGVDLSAYTTEEFVTGVSGYLQGQISSNDSEITEIVNSTGSFALKSETGSFISESQTGQFYAASNPSGYITGVDLSSYVQDSETGAFYVSSNPSGFITGVDLSSYVQNSETGLFLVSGEDAVVNNLTTSGNIGIGTSSPQAPLHVSGGAILSGGNLQIGSTPAYSYDRSIKLHDNGVQFGARVSLIGTNDNAGPGLEMVTDGSLSKRTIIRHEGEGSNDYGLSFFTTNNGTVSEKVRFDGNGNVGIGTSSPTEKLEVSGDLMLQENGVIKNKNNNTQFRFGANDLYLDSGHLRAGYSVGIRGQRGSTKGMEQGSTRNSDLGLYCASIEAVSIRNNGNVDANYNFTINQDLSVSGDSSFSSRPTVNGTGVLLIGEGGGGGGGTVENVVYTTGDQTISGTKSFGKISLSENSFVTETGSFTMGSTHRGATVLLQNSAPMTVTIPAQVSGHTTTFIAETSNSVVFATGAGISGFNSFNSANQIAGIYGQAQVIFKSPEYAFLGGNVV